MKLRDKVNKVQRKTDIVFVRRMKSLVALFMVFFFCINLGAVGYIMVFHGEEYREAAARNQLYDETIDAVRGTIYDRNMTPLVTSTSAWILCTNPNEIRKAFEKYDSSYLEEFYTYLSKGIAKAVSAKTKDVKALIMRPESRYVRVKREVTPTQKIALQTFLESEYAFKVPVEVSHWGKKTTELKERKIRPSKFFSYENDSKRVYTQKKFASTLIGVVNADGIGQTGIEQYYNDVLSGESGRIVTAKDSRGNVLESSYETVFDATDGNGVVLTIDENIQSYLENALEQANESIKPDGVYGIVMDVDTGAILAMSDKPDFDLTNSGKLVKKSDRDILKEFKEGTEEYNEKYSSLLYDQWSSFCVTDTYEPGSTFKIFTASAAIEEGTASLNTTYTCRGACNILGTPYGCASRKAHGTQTLTQMLMNSCNCGFINVGQTLGKDNYYKYFEAFGFTERTGIDIGNEAYPFVHKQEKMSKVDLASTSFGQSIRISPLQLITATCAIANGGKLMKPYFVSKIVDSEGNVVSETEPTVRRTVISESTCAKVRSMMEAVVEGGTGKNAYIAGYRVAGKTATAEKLDDGSDEDIYIASFVCFAPANDPEVAILVGVDNAPGPYRGGGVLAAPIAKEVMESTLEYLNVEPQYTAKELAAVSRVTPSLVGKKVSTAKVSAASEGFTAKVIGKGDTVVSQVPASGQSIPKNGVIILYTEKNSESQEVKVPDFTGLTASQVNSLATQNGLNVIFSGPAEASGALSYNQDVAKETAVDAGSNITVYFRQENIAVD